MPDFERRIAEWRLAMAKHFHGREEVLDELESHLRDEVEHLIEGNGTPEQALWTAMSRLGRAEEIAKEFAKVPAPLAPWLPVRLVWIGGAVGAAWLARPLTPRFASGGLDALLAVHRIAVMLGYLATLLVGSLAICFLLTRLFHDLNNGQIRSLKRSTAALSALAATLTGGGIAIGCFCPYEKHGWFWGLNAHEVGGLLILLWNIAMLLHILRRQRGGPAMMLPGILGNIVVLLGWFGAAFVEKNPHGPLAGGGVMIFVLLLSQLAVSCAAFAPAGCLRGKRS
jgi:hypothetical protein